MAYVPSNEEVDAISTGINNNYVPSDADIDAISDSDSPEQNTSFWNLFAPGLSPTTIPASEAVKPLNIFGKGALQSLLTPAATLANWGIKGAKLLDPNLKMRPFDPTLLTPEEEKSPYSTAGEVVGDIGGFFAGGEAADAALGLLKAAPYIGRGAKFLADVGGGGLKRALGGGTFGALSNPEHPVKGALWGVGSSVVPEYALPGGKKLLSLPLKYLQKGARNTLGEAQAIDQASGAPLSVFDISGNQGWQRALNNYMGKIPFSGVKGAMQKAVDFAQNKTSEFMDYLKGKADPSEIDNKIKDSILSNFFKVKKPQDIENYRNVSQLAEDAGISIKDRSNLISTAKKYINDHNNALKSGNESGLDNQSIVSLKKILKNDFSPDELIEPSKPSSLIDLDTSIQKAKLGEIQKPIGTQSKKLLPSNLDQALSSRSIYGDKAQFHYGRGNNYLGKMHNDLKEALNTDIENSISKSGRKDIKNAWENAKNYHSNEIIPYTRNGNITRLSNNTMSIDKIHNFLLQGQNEKILQDLSPADRKLVTYSLLQKAATKKVDNSNELDWSPSKIINKIDSLTPKQHENLFTGKQKDDIGQLRALIKGNKENVLSLNKPATGFGLMGDKILPSLAAGAAGVAGYTGNLPLALGLMGTLSAGSNLSNRLLRSRALKDMYLNPESKIVGKKPGLVTRALIGSIAGSK